MLRSLIYLLTLVLTASQAYSQVDLEVKASQVYLKKKDKYKSLDEVNDEIIQSEMSDIEKTRSIFNWITHNIKYDCKRRDKSLKLDKKNSKYKKKHKDKRKHLQVYEPVEIINRGMGICSDYALVFDQLCKLNVIESDIISGYARNEPSKIGRMFKVNHAWNRVKLNDEFFYVDATWSSGYSVDDCKQFVHRPDTAYFLVDQKRFQYDHFPQSSSKDTNYIKAKGQFFKYPDIGKGFFINRLDTFYPQEGIAKVKLDSTFTFYIYSKSSIEDYSIYSEKGEVNISGSLEYLDNRYEIQFTPQKTGYQFITLFIDGLATLTYKFYVRR